MDKFPCQFQRRSQKNRAVSSVYDSTYNHYTGIVIALATGPITTSHFHRCKRFTYLCRHTQPVPICGWKRSTESGRLHRQIYGAGMPLLRRSAALCPPDGLILTESRNLCAKIQRTVKTMTVVLVTAILLPRIKNHHNASTSFASIHYIQKPSVIHLKKNRKNNRSPSGLPLPE